MPTQQLSQTGEDTAAAMQIYDMIMSGIELDLQSYMIGRLDEIYEGETVEERATRMQRYEKAYKQFDEVFQGFTQELAQQAHDYRRQALKTAESQDDSEEQQALQDLSSQFSA